MKRCMLSAGLLILAGIILLLASNGCASSRARNMESLLTAAGFHTITPVTPPQQAAFAALPPYKLQRQETQGHIVYAYADKRTGTLYVGDEAQYHQFKQLVRQQRIATEEYETARMNQAAGMDWGFWGPPGWR